MLARILILVPALVLSGCASSNKIEPLSKTIAKAMARQNAGRSQSTYVPNIQPTYGIQQGLNNGNAMIQQGQQGMSKLQPYSYQRSDGVWVYCNKTSSYTVNCRTN